MATGRRLLIICLLALLAREASCQTLESLREDIKRAEREISITNDLLSKTRKNQQSADKELKLIRNKIRNRRNIISNLEQQAGLLNRNIDEKGSTIASLEQDLARLRKEYGEMVYSAYKNYKLNSFLVFLFSSKDFNDATRRIAYMRRYNRMREQKAARIDSTAASLGREVTDLQNKKSELDKVYQSRNRELASLGKDETQYKASSEKFRNEASRLASTIKQNKKKIEQLQQRIQRLIEAESRKHKAQPRSAAQNEYIAKLSGQFDQNRGKLPYPVRGVIVDGYGKHGPAGRHLLVRPSERDGQQYGNQYRGRGGRAGKSRVRRRGQRGVLRARHEQRGHDPARRLCDRLCQSGSRRGEDRRPGRAEPDHRQAAGRRRLPAFRDMERPAESESGALAAQIGNTNLKRICP